MTPPRIDYDTIQRRLRLLRDTLDQLTPLRDITADDLDTDALVRAAAERLLQVIVDLSLDINGHIVVASLGRAPETGRSSFIELGECGVIPGDLANRLAPSAGMRNVLVHHYIDIRTDLVAASINQTLAVFPAYVEAVAAFLTNKHP